MLSCRTKHVLSVSMLKYINRESSSRLTDQSDNTLTKGLHLHLTHTPLAPYNTKHPFIGDRSLHRVRQALGSPCRTQRGRAQTQTNAAINGDTSKLSWHTTRHSGKYRGSKTTGSPVKPHRCRLFISLFIYDFPLMCYLRQCLGTSGMVLYSLDFVCFSCGYCVFYSLPKNSTFLLSLGRIKRVQCYFLI